LPLNKVNLLSPLVNNSSSVTPENLQRWAYNNVDVAAITPTGMLDLRYTTTGSLVSGGLNGNLGTKIVFYSNDLINPSYGFGLQGGRLVGLVDAGGAFSLRTSIGGSDVVRLNNDGNISGRYVDSLANSGAYLDMGVGSSGILVMNRNTGHVPISIRAVASQSSSLTEWQNSAGTAVAKINQVGSAIFGDASQNAVGHINAFSASASSIPLVLQEYSLGGQTADLTQWRSAATTVIAKVDVSGRITAQSFIPSSSTVPSNGMYLSAANTLNFATNTTNRMSIDSTGAVVIGGTLTAGSSANKTTAYPVAPVGTTSGTVTQSAQLSGYIGMPQNAQATSGTFAYTFAASDAGKHIYATGTPSSVTFTIPANSAVAFEIGTTFVVMNDLGAATNISIAITTDTLQLAGTGTTGTRTLARYGVASITKVTSTKWIISGNGLT
jgi:hypothetical protein